MLALEDVGAAIEDARQTRSTIRQLRDEARRTVPRDAIRARSSILAATLTNRLLRGPSQRLVKPLNAAKCEPRARPAGSGQG